MGFLDDIFKGDKKKGGSTTGGGLQNPFGGPRTFHGQGQSLGGSKPGRVIQITLSNPGPLGVRVEKRPNSGGTAIVNMVVAGSQAEAAGMKRGDILCFAGSNGQEEMMYEMFLDLAKSEQRPIHIEIRRIDRELKKQHKTSADVDHRRQAVIAAAEAREKAHKAKSKPLKHITKTTLAKQQQQQQQLQEGNLSGEDLNSEVSNEPLTVEAQKAAALAKQGEAQLAAQLGYNPYETARSTAGQARTATTVATHGTITAPNHAGENLPTLPTVDPPREAAIPEEESFTEVDFPAEYTDAYAIMVSSNEASTVKSSCAIMRKLLINATTKGQTPGDDAAKFRKVRLANKKIKAAIVDVPGAVELMLSTGFYVAEQDGESVLIFPADFPGPDWLPAALKHLE